MNNEINMNMYNSITNWGIPNIPELQNRKIEFIFDSSKIPNINSYYQNLECTDNSAKFCLYDYDNKEILFSMDFFIPPSSLFLITNKKIFVKLELLNVNDYKLRKKGIASYYLTKLKEYCITRNISRIEVTPFPNAKIFKNQNKENALSLDELKQFYIKHSTSKVKIIPTK